MIQGEDDFESSHKHIRAIWTVESH